MTLRPCALCRTPTPWEGIPWKPFCSERCQTLDLGAWASENYRVPEKATEEDGEAWSGDDQPPS